MGGFPYASVLSRHLPPTRPLHRRLVEAVRARVVGQDHALHHLVVTLLAGGHALLEGVPGLAKTLLARSVAEALDVSFRRIQFTPDLLPADILGSMVFQKETGTFVPAPGPIFANLVLADEINRAPPKVQSALLEAMEEGEVTLGGETFPLREPFMVLATQNPLEHHGTYPLAEAQVDRFLVHIRMSYPTPAEEREILRCVARHRPRRVPPVVEVDELLSARREVGEVYVDDRVQAYIVSLLEATRHPQAVGLDELAPWIALGVSPRGGIALQRAARAQAWLSGRDHVLPDDVKAMVPAVFRHRIVPSLEGEAEGVDPDRLVGSILRAVPVP